MKSVFVGLMMASAILSAAVDAQESQPTATSNESRPIVEFGVVVVTGSHPAPGLWKLTRGGKTLLIMGTMSPAPERMVWMSNNVEARIAKSQAILGPPGVVLGTDVGLLRGLML